MMWTGWCIRQMEANTATYDRMKQRGKVAVVMKTQYNDTLRDSDQAKDVLSPAVTILPHFTSLEAASAQAKRPSHGISNTTSQLLDNDVRETAPMCIQYPRFSLRRF